MMERRVDMDQAESRRCRDSGGGWAGTQTWSSSGPEVEGWSGGSSAQGNTWSICGFERGPWSLICAAGVVITLNVASSQAAVNTQEDSRTEFTK